MTITKEAVFIQTIGQAMDIIEGNDALPMVEFGAIITKPNAFTIEYLYMERVHEITMTDQEIDKPLDEVVNVMISKLIGESL